MIALTTDLRPSLDMVEEFAKRRHLLETLAMDIAERIQVQFDEIESLLITIRKLNPPITNFSGSVAITYSREFKSQ